MQTYKKNGTTRSEPEITDFKNKSGYTHIIFTPDYEYFEYPKINNYGIDDNRSEEHTSELQSHSFISYAVFCLKKKKT